MGVYNSNGAMLRWSDQLILAAESHHFEGSTHLKSKEGTNARLVEGGGIFVYLVFAPSFVEFVEMSAIFNVMVLRRQDELVGPLQHGPIRITHSHDHGVEFRGTGEV